MANSQGTSPVTDKLTFSEIRPWRYSHINELRHYLNSGHYYCRLIKKGVCKEEAKKRAKKYQVFANFLDEKMLTPLQKIEYFIKDMWSEEYS